MKRVNKIIWGIVLVAVGAIFTLNAIGLTDIDVFFKGWWTLFIIVPGLIGFLTERDKLGNFIVLAVGVALLLGCRGLLEFKLIINLIVPILVIIFGIKMIFSGIINKKCSNKNENNTSNSADSNGEYFAIFSGKDISFNGICFTGCSIKAIFGGLECNLSEAIVLSDCIIDATAIFGGIDIIVPQNVNIKINSTSLFGGVSDETRRTYIDGAPTVYINATCVFGGIDVK